ncbi:MAG: hypothetical protein HC837_13175, partial [Chloroflexaceae bacterium]|nr:hypothetical protein [Chloroflexaceae bacterium]
MIALLLYLAVRDGSAFWRRRWSEVLVWLGALLISAAPMIQYALIFPEDYNARVNEVGIMQSGWLEQEQELRGEGALPILLDQFTRAALAFNAYPDRTIWYGAPQPCW